jgi:hypothetical protein
MQAYVHLDMHDLSPLSLFFLSMALSFFGLLGIDGKGYQRRKRQRALRCHAECRLLGGRSEMLHDPAPGFCPVTISLALSFLALTNAIALVVPPWQWRLDFCVLIMGVHHWTNYIIRRGQLLF